MEQRHIFHVPPEWAQLERAGVSASAILLCRGLLENDPLRRITAETALKLAQAWEDELTKGEGGSAGGGGGRGAGVAGAEGAGAGGAGATGGAGGGGSWGSSASGHVVSASLRKAARRDTLSRRVRVMLASRLNVVQLSRINELFSQLDADSDGVLSSTGTV
jgi:hypothetical protein